MRRQAYVSLLALALLLAGAAAGCRCARGGGDGGSGGDAATDSGPAAVRYTFRALGGISMGGAGAAMLGLMHADELDTVMALGTSMDTTSYLLRVRGALGGFCEPPVPGTSCPPADGSAYFEDFGPDSVGFDRRGLLLGYSDAALAFGNWLWHSAESTYLPAGVPLARLALTAAERCAAPLVLPGYVDARWNPAGLYDAVTFCDGDEAPGTDTAFDPAGVHDLPVDYLLALDLDGDGLRGAGEPVLVQPSEPFEDTGADGVPSALEPGYDAVSSPDPAGDDYDPFINATGTENDGRRDEGEPYQDLGFDGVAGTAATNPFDAGEGNGVFDRSANHAYLDAVDPPELLPGADFSRFALWVDIGIRDELGFYADTASFAGKAAAAGLPFARYDGFAALPFDGPAFDVRTTRFGELGPRVLLVYGDPAATAAEIAAGDGGHVDPAQVLNRILTAITYAAARWPLPRVPIPGSGRDEIGTFYSPALAADRDLIVHVPPGYDAEPERRYPVIFFLHGFGMVPMDLVALALLADAVVNAGAVPPFLFVLPSGRCEGIECDTGSFFLDHAGYDGAGARFGEMIVVDLFQHVDATYRTLAEAVLLPPS